jgi:ubiquinone/menaquinone biosynthesis C-methylase UbiE
MQNTELSAKQMNSVPLNKLPVSTIRTANREIPVYDNTDNFDEKTVHSFGEEWNAFHGFDETDIQTLGNDYFDIVTNEMLNSSTAVLDIGCGSGRFIKYLSNRAGSIVGADPSQAIFAADQLIGKNEKVTLVKASANDLPFDKESFDFVYCIGVLHHIPDTFKAMQACVEKVKKEGYFLTYLYYNFDNRGVAFRSVYKLSNLLRLGICKLPTKPKKMVCDVLAISVYMPFILFNRGLKAIGVGKKIRSKIPLVGYEDKSFYIIRNDSLDRFGTPLEQRFTKKEIQAMMEKCGLKNIVFSDKIPFWHAVGQKV